MKELYDAIEAHEPKVTVEIPVGRMHCGFFKDIPNAPAVEEGLVLQNQDMQPIGYDLDDFQVPVVQVPS